MEFAGRRVVVAGGSRGIGRSVALGFARKGAAVSICARGAETLEATRREIEAFGVAAHAGPCDLADEEAVARYVGDAAAALGGSEHREREFGRGAGWVTGQTIVVDGGQLVGP